MCGHLRELYTSTFLQPFKTMALKTHENTHVNMLTENVRLEKKDSIGKFFIIYIII